MDQFVEFIPTSQLFRAILAGAPRDHVTLAWMLGNLRRRSFGMIMLLLGLIAMIPGVCVLAGFVLGILGFQMMMAHETPLCPALSRCASCQLIVSRISWAGPFPSWKP